LGVDPHVSEATREEDRKMRKSLIVTLLVVAGAAVPWVASAQDCRYQKVKADMTTFTYLDSPIAPYDLCWEINVAGTLNGTYVGCIYFNEGIPSSDIYGDGYTQIQATKYYSWISTKHGEVQFVEWSWLDWDSFNEAGFGIVVGGTGRFEDASGSMYYTPRFPNAGPVVFFEGYICTP